jgi:hypothetical protein
VWHKYHATGILSLSLSLSLSLIYVPVHVVFVDVSVPHTGSTYALDVLDCRVARREEAQKVAVRAARCKGAVAVLFPSK